MKSASVMRRKSDATPPTVGMNSAPRSSAGIENGAKKRGSRTVTCAMLTSSFRRDVSICTNTDPDSERLCCTRSRTAPLAAWMADTRIVTRIAISGIVVRTMMRVRMRPNRNMGFPGCGGFPLQVHVDVVDPVADRHLHGAVAQVGVPYAQRVAPVGEIGEV